jgi:hypothetical protein
VKSSPRSYPQPPLLTRTSCVHRDELCWISALNNRGHGPGHRHTGLRRALLPAPAAFELARGAPTRETAAGSTLRGVLLEFLAPPRQFCCSRRDAQAGSFARVIIVEMSTGDTRHVEPMTTRALGGCGTLLDGRSGVLRAWRRYEVAHGRSTSETHFTKRKWPSGGPKAS